MTTPNLSTSRRVVIVGAGQAGGATADALRRFGFEGPITLLGDELVPPYERPPLSKDILLGRMVAEQTHMFAQNHWTGINVGLELGTRVEAVDRSIAAVVVGGGRHIAYDVLVIATGASVRRLSAPGADSERLFYLRTQADAEHLKASIVPGLRLAIVGAGFIGLEVAASARRLGADVVVLEAADRPLARLLPRRFSDWMTKLHAAQDVAILCGRQLEIVRQTDTGIELGLSDGTLVNADIAVVGIGAVPNTALAEAAGLVCRDGIVVDEECRSSDPCIFAIGDVARHTDPLFEREWRLESWRNALDQAATAASAIHGGPAPPYQAPWFWTDQYDRNIQIAGVPDDSLELVERGDPDVGPYMAFFLQNATVRGAIAVDAGRDMRIVRDLIRNRSTVESRMLADPSIRLSRS
jgi:3-phenylpropionate/trans-cinnamate dioxygenase ferredoxin reductase component